MMIQLKTLEDHNKEFMENWRAYATNEPSPNGIECPECGSELLDSKPDMVLASLPPQLNVHCPDCDYRGFRVV